MKGQQGFSILEVMVATAIAGVLVAIFVYGTYHSGFYREYVLSMQANQLVAALNSTRQRAMASAFTEKATYRPTDNACTLRITNSWGDVPSGSTHQEWTFTGQSPNPPGFRDGDYVSFSGLNAPASPCPSGAGGPDMSVMNGGIFQIHKVQSTTGTQVDPPLASPNPYPDYSVETLPVAGAPPTKGYYQIAFNVTYYCASCTATSRDSCTYAGGAPNVVSPDAATAVVSPAFAKNQTRASQLIIRRNSVILPLQAARQALDPTDGIFYGDVYYCYDDRPQNDSSVPPSPTVMITELNDIKNYDAQNLSTGVPLMDDISVFYTAQGLPVNGTGYLFSITYTRFPNVTGSSGLLQRTASMMSRQKVVTVNALGKASLGQTY